jgi:hypothetical protein
MNYDKIHVKTGEQRTVWGSFDAFKIVLDFLNNHQLRGFLVSGDFHVEQNNSSFTLNVIDNMAFEFASELEDFLKQHFNDVEVTIKLAGL